MQAIAELRPGVIAGAASLCGGADRPPPGGALARVPQVEGDAQVPARVRASLRGGLGANPDGRHLGWSLRELTPVRIAQDDMNLILGGNAARAFGLDTKVLKKVP